MQAYWWDMKSIDKETSVGVNAADLLQGISCYHVL